MKYTKPRVLESGGSYLIETPYDQNFVEALKNQIPSSFRKYDGERKVWIVSPQYGKTITDLIARYFYERVGLPKIKTEETTRTFRVEYLGAAKQRNSGDSFASGWANGSWSVVFPEEVLRNWFGEEDWKPGDRTTLYGVLGIPRNSGLHEVKAAYKRLARLWHPDVNRDADAEEQFKKINEAHRVLSDSVSKKKYDAGLQFELLTPRELLPEREPYRPPIRCGLIKAEGMLTATGGFNVQKILQWDDIIENGRIMNSFWDMSTGKFITYWKKLQPDTDFFND